MEYSRFTSRSDVIAKIIVANCICAFLSIFLHMDVAVAEGPNGGITIASHIVVSADETGAATAVDVTEFTDEVLRAQGGTGLRAQGGTGVRAPNIIYGDAIFNSYVSGPIERVDAAQSTISVLNKTYELEGASDITDGRIAQDQIAVILGCADEMQSETVFVSSRYYAEGYDQVVLQGVVTGIEFATGTFSVNGYTIDYNHLLISPSSKLDVSIGDHAVVQGHLYRN